MCHLSRWQASIILMNVNMPGSTDPGQSICNTGGVFQNVFLVNRRTHTVFCCVCWERGHYLHGDWCRGQHQGPGLQRYEMLPLWRESEEIHHNFISVYLSANSIIDACLFFSSCTFCLLLYTHICISPPHLLHRQHGASHFGSAA